MLFAFLFSAVLIGLLATRLLHEPKWVKNSLMAVVCAAVLLSSMAQPALAGAVQGNALSNDQKDLNETLLTTPNKNQYQGIEYADVKGTPLSDREITSRVEDAVPGELKISVSNGSVRLSGKVADRSAAQAIINQVKAIPGVHEIAYDLGLGKMPDQQ